jgi:hypothetical protein
MKHLLTWVSLLFSITAFSQLDGVCYVTSVKGDVREDDQKIKAGDTLSYQRIKNLVSNSKKGLVTFYHPTAGSFRVYTSNLHTETHREGAIDFAAELLKMKGKSVPLSSRGTCDCAFLRDCLYTDSGINQALLLTDTISFPREEDVADSLFYFLQLKTATGIISNRLRSNKENIMITQYDLNFNGYNYGDSDSEIILGKCKFLNGKKTFVMVSSLRFTVASPSFLISYYQALQNAMKNYPAKDVFEIYYRDIYLYYGKPAACQLKKIIGYTD